MDNSFILGKDRDGNTVALRVDSDGTLATDSYLDIAKCNLSGTTHINKFGKQLITGSGVANNDIMGNGSGVYTPPTANRIHQVKSDSIQDKGTLIGTYTSTTFGLDKFIDSGATFITDGVSVGDVIVNDTNGDHSLVVSVDSETVLTVENWHHSEDSNVGDTFRIGSSNGTGAVFVHIKNGQQKDGTELTEFILMNGTTNVPTVNTYFRITRVHVHGVGTNKTNVGTITLIADTDATTTALISPNTGQTLMAFYHIPYGKTGYLTSLYSSMFRSDKVSDAAADIQLMSNLWGSDGVNTEFSIAVGSAGVNKDFKPYKVISQGTDIWIRSINTTDTNSTISAGFDIILVDNA